VRRAFWRRGERRGGRSPPVILSLVMGKQGEREMGTDDKVGVHHNGARRSIDSACAMGEIADEKVRHG